ncbi:MAG TPA: GNAT family N-acetyltransferase [Myxococcaceae bacterium]|nr:GNAT family N-acetyltransferase [Myxococcaceae bacterium]
MIDVSTRDEEALHLVEARPVGTSLWLSGYGQSLWPLIRTTDAFRVRRCEAEEIRAGDVVLVRTEGGELAVRLAVSARPLETAALRSRVDVGAARLLGRVDRVRRGSLELWLPRALSPLLRAVHRAASATSRHPLARGVTQGARSALSSGATLPLRRAYLGAVQVRPLGPEDWTALFTFAGNHLRISAAFLRQQLQDRWAERRAAIGGLARGAMIGFCWVDEYRQEGFELDGLWIRSLYVRPMARGMGVARKIVEHACQAAASTGAHQVYADVEDINEPSLRVFRSLGFKRAAAALEARLNDEWRMRGRAFRLVVLEKAL